MTYRPLSEVLPAAAHALGLRTEGPAWIPSCRTLVVFLVDGLGYLNLTQSGLDSDLVSQIAVGDIGITAVPSTTPVALATLGVGEGPGHHGIVGATFELPDLDVFLRPLGWQSEPAPTAVQPEPTWFEQIAATGVPVTRIGPGQYAGSGLTQAVLRGGVHRPAEDLDELVLAVCAAASEPGLVYAYYPQLDKLGHVHGVISDEWRMELLAVLNAVTRLRRLLPAGVQLLLTADHGMLDAGPRLWIEDRPGLLSAMRALGGEPRLRHVYAEPGSESKLLRDWQAVADVADVYSRDGFIEEFWPAGAEFYARERVGDVVAVARGNELLASRRFDSKVSSLKGQHGSSSDVECQIPMALLAG